MRILAAVVELAGFAAVLVSAYIIHPALILAIGGLLVVAAANARRPE